MQTFTDLYRYRFVLSSLVSKNLKVMYRTMALGMLWTLLNPLVMITTLSVVWVFVFKTSAEFVASVIVTLIPYNFVVYCLSGCVNSIPGNAPLVKKIGFPRQILPVSIILTHLIHFAIQSTLIVVILVIFPSPGDAFGFHLLWLVPIFIVQLGFCIGAGLLVAGLNVLYRDVQYIVDSIITILFWVCPILYENKELTGLDPWLYNLYYLNPLAGILTAYRDVLFYGQGPDLHTFGHAILETVIIGYFGVRTFWKHEREFADLI